MEYGTHRLLFNLFHAALRLFIAVFAIFLSNVSLADETDPQYVLALGDSLMAGYMLDPEDAFPVQLEAALIKDGVQVKVINAGVSGDTTKGGLARLSWALSDIPGGKPHLAIVELGANDAMQGLDPERAKANLSAIIVSLKATGAKVLLAGMLASPNMGGDYMADFDPIYGQLAEEHGIALYPFFLDGVATFPELNLADGKHPTGVGVSIIVTRMLPLVKRLLTE
jgi:acyl-CoA thioesterase-1